jgi:hypothetical protein
VESVRIAFVAGRPASRTEFRIERLKTWLAGARSRRVIFLLGGLLTLPSINRRLLFDDHLQAVLRMPKPPIEGLVHTSLDLFTFGKPGPVNDTFIERGIMVPWWTYPGYRVSFFRPLSAFTHAVDGWLWPQSPVMAHVHSIAWYLLLLVLVLRLYSQFVQPAWLAGLAFALFAFDDVHADTISWIANRHAVIATAAALFAFELHASAQARGGQQSALGPVCLAAALLAGETATAACAYLFAYALFVDPAPRRSRALSVLPYVILVLAWRVVYQRLGYGAFASDDYIDPAREPVAFLVRFPQAFVMLLQGELGGIASDFWGVSSPRDAVALAAGALATCCVFFALAYPLLRRDKMARFWCASFAGAIIPSTASTPSDRTLLFASIAGAGLLAQLMGAFIERQFRWREGGRWRALATVPMALLVARKLFIAPLLFPIRDRTMYMLEEINDRAADAVPEIADLAERSLIVVNPPSIEMASFIPLIRATRAQAIPRTVRLFATAGSAMTLTRQSERELRVRPADGFLAPGADRVFRSERYPMKPGEKVELSDMTITITALRSDGNPSEAAFVFREALESSKHLWLAWDQHGCHSFSPPRIGETVTLKAIDLWKLQKEMWWASSAQGKTQ